MSELHWILPPRYLQKWLRDVRLGHFKPQLVSWSCRVHKSHSRADYRRNSIEKSMKWRWVYFPRIIDIGGGLVSFPASFENHNDEGSLFMDCVQIRLARCEWLLQRCWIRQHPLE
jgi:hypothetical protein